MVFAGSVDCLEGYFEDVGCLDVCVSLSLESGWIWMVAVLVL